uniref:Rad60/SUMO-like domain-containing protein n=1 Tax=Canis lupus dingo TaxID=286419 RepID=A0A8C0KL07_CANLU
MANEKPKEGVKTENNDHINLKVAGQDGSVVQFKIKRHTPLRKLTKAYCERQGFKVCQDVIISSVHMDKSCCSAAEWLCWSLSKTDEDVTVMRGH